VRWTSETAITRGASRARVLCIQKEAEEGPVVTPDKKGRSRREECFRDIKFVYFDRSGMRQEVHVLYFRN
jgi:hypothetical protein